MIKPGIYKHAKSGNEYRVLGVAKHSETSEDLVVYETMYANPVSNHWVRPVKMFEEIVEIDGIDTPRFVFVREN